MSDLRLRLTTDEPDLDPPTYRFPVEQVRGMTALDADEDEMASMDALDLAHQIDQALDVLQERLDDVKEEMEDVYRFPDPDDWRPTAA